ncbi:protein FAM167A-like [Saccostrea echinata]|uniref:protein FAM167A-like n=1 Tax=Saccostrea echinata TaxID=191078 RepID=UPI002A7ECADA|nr:protein FAM167A-like [Saccostrea echinata]
MKRKGIRQAFSASDIKSVDTLPPLDIYLFRLKCKTRKLRLDTRRPSYLEWRASLKRYRAENEHDLDRNKGVPNDQDFEKINNSLKWIREELTKMREQDQDLARQFLTIHSDIQKLRLEWSWQYHEFSLQDALIDYQEVEEIKRISDLPLVSDTEMSLVDRGLTKMNLCHRKYSVT